MNFALACLQRGELRGAGPNTSGGSAAANIPFSRRVCRSGMARDWRAAAFCSGQSRAWATPFSSCGTRRLSRRRAAMSCVSCPPALMSVVGTCPGVSQVIREGTPQTGFACHAPLMSLPRIFATTLETIPASIPYLSADPARASRWGGELGRYDGFKIGIAWQGNTDHKKDHLRSFRLERFEALGRIPGVRLFSLQVGSSTKQLQEISDRFSVIDVGSRVDDFMDTAALVQHLDLVITPDTSLAHLAGALGLPVWVAIPFASDWRLAARPRGYPLVSDHAPLSPGPVG